MFDCASPVIQKRCIHKVNIPYYNVYTSFWNTLYIYIYVYIVATTVGVYISVHWFITAQNDTLWHAIYIEQGCQAVKSIFVHEEHSFLGRNMILCQNVQF
jgi:type III secretory pathway component EscS